MTNTVHHGDCLTVLKTFPDEFIDCCVTSPPYWGLRDYGVSGQLGLEKTPEEYVAKMVEVFREVRRVLRRDGTLWLNLGDSYASNGCYLHSWMEKHPEKKHLHTKNAEKYKDTPAFRGGEYRIKAKDLVGIPWRVAFALQADGWWLRQDIIWHKPNPMPESVTDRPTKSHEYIFLMSKSAKYYFDQEAVREDSIDPESYNGRRPRNAPSMYFKDPKNLKCFGSIKDGKLPYGMTYEKRNIRSVWTITTQPYSQAHFATFPPKLIEPCILAGCPENGIVLDPFIGSGTVAQVATLHRRNWIGIELNPEYIKLADKRRQVTPRLL